MEPLRHDMTRGLETGSGWRTGRGRALLAAHGPDSSSCGNFQPKWLCPTGRRSEELKISPTRFLNPSARPEERDGGSEEQAAEERRSMCCLAEPWTWERKGREPFKNRSERGLLTGQKGTVLYETRDKGFPPTHRMRPGKAHLLQLTIPTVPSGSDLLEF